MTLARRLILIFMLLTTGLVAAFPAGAVPIGNDAFQRTWDRTDKPVAALAVSRTWMWGPEATTGVIKEPFIESPGTQRDIQYFDKSRMEINDPNGDKNSIWYVTNGLLATELISGRMQIGENIFEYRLPAQVNVSGDPDDPNAPTYATFNGLLGAGARPANSVVTQRLARNGSVTNDSGLGSRNVTIAYTDDVTHHSVPNVFWDFMNSSGTVWENGQFITAPLFQNPFFATGRPITEAYWTTVKVAGTPKDVLLQCFERRCLTYTPDNPEGWKVEAGNVGQHYYQWRYGSGAPRETSVPYWSDMVDWKTFNQNGNAGTVANGTYHITAAQNKFPRVPAQGVNVGDGSVSVRVRMVSNSQKAAACLLTRMVGNDTQDYSLCLASNGKAQASYNFVNGQGQPQSTVLLATQTYPGTLPANAWNTLKITAKGQSLWFFINGVLMGKVDHAGPNGGGVAVGVGNGDAAAAEFEFTNLTLYGVE